MLSTSALSTAFVFIGRCVFNAPCHCDGSSSVSCIYASLTDIPQITARNSDPYVALLRISLHHNHIHSIPAKVFKNVSAIHTTSIYFILNDNDISYIDDQAFEGAENKTTSLDLRNNHLTRLPSAFVKFTQLGALSLEGNPLVTLDYQIMFHLSTLFLFGFDMGKFESWPDLSMLGNLQILIMNYIPFTNMPMDAFAAFEAGLTTLTLSYSKLVNTPPALCRLQNLDEFNFDNGATHIADYSLFGVCSHNLTKLKRLSLQNNSLDLFPDLLQSLPSLNTLYLDNNRIGHIHTNNIPLYSKLGQLRMENNSLTQIPFALNKLKLLSALNLAGNRITTIEDNDVAGLNNIVTLTLNNNPIEYVAPKAFIENKHLVSLEMDNTSLHLIPEAVRYAPSPPMLYFDNDNDCSCNMDYLKDWNATATFVVFGSCDNEPTLGRHGLGHFLRTKLPSCP